MKLILRMYRSISILMIDSPVGQVEGLMFSLPKMLFFHD